MPMHETGRVPEAGALADRVAIYDVLVRHSRGVDRGDSAILRSAYWPDAEVAYGAFDGLARGTRDARDRVYAHLGS